MELTLTSGIIGVLILLVIAYFVWKAVRPDKANHFEDKVEDKWDDVKEDVKTKWDDIRK